MSKDIRSFFITTKKPVKSKEAVPDDDDIIPESPDVQIKKKKKEARKKRVILDDSDDEIQTKKPKKSETHLNKKNKSTAELKEVKPIDLFGNAPIVRTEPIVKKEKNKTELGIHSDDEFEKSLLEIDEIDHLEKNKNIDFTPLENGNNDKSHERKLQKEMKQKESIKLDKDLLPSLKDKEKKTDSYNVNNLKNKSIIDEVKEGNKRKFSEFIETNIKDENAVSKKIKIEKKHKDESFSSKVESDLEMNCSAIDDEAGKKITKNRGNKSLNESVLSDEERHQRRVQSAALYKKYLNRSAPKHLGSKEIPVGAPDCLKDCAFLLTGVLDSFEREEIEEAIKRYGGTVKPGVSRKVNYVLVGEDPGPAKIAKATDLGIPILNEDEFLKLISNSVNNTKLTTRDKGLKEKNIASKSKDEKERKCEKSSSKERKKDKSKSPIKIKEENRNSTSKPSDDNVQNQVKTLNSEKQSSSRESVSSLGIGLKCEQNHDTKCNKYMWVDKYKPQNVKQIIGQHGDSSNVKKLINWLTKWYVNRKAKLPKPSPWAKNDDGGYFKAALLSGPPGVGKTTTVSLVCRELGFDAVEFNASDTRNKSLLKEQIGELLSTTSLSGYAKGDTSKQAVSKKHVLVMDEVDGMAGNEDRGGLQELINLIKSTSVPVICMCNDRNSTKMRSLVNYCYDLRFNRPRVDQIRAAMMSICFKEGIKVAPDVLTQLIVASNQDVRQTLNLLSMWAVDEALASADKLKRDANTTKKDVKLGPWEAVRKVFSAEEHKTMSIHDKSDLFFYDYNLAPLFVQENYLQVAPHCPKHEVLERFSKAADSISIGDMVSARIRGSQAWSLLPIQAMYSSVLPGHVVSGHVVGQIQFPGWLGKNSRANKMHRLAQEIHAHTRLSTSGSKSSIYLDYSSHLRDAIVNPLINEKTDGITKSLEILESYHLLREDLDSLIELSLWPGQRNPTVLIEAKVKAAMTRTYNKTASALPYAPGAVKKGRNRNDDEMDDGDEAGDVTEEENSDAENDAFIKKKKTKDSEKSDLSKEKPSTSKAKTNKEKKKKK
ncbi:replication factor C subunit 1 [Bombyx mandarina]|uniref:Replication factor C subunit 1 n=1 Tax=Bombyx mandarina TaxID=7092 RepID=A0A6J2KB11_BOMMA|nr:replication factor C subunit 1 [Bombyx mandarina]